ncbi:MAG: alpha-amylase family glycosyl hydrolase [Sphingomonas sp.]
MRIFSSIAAVMMGLGAVCAAPALAAAPGAIPARYTPKPYIELKHPAWSRDAVLYQINTRQFTQEGSFASAEKQLPRLKALGVDILWLMPIHPIGEKNRKGGLGSPYSVRDYYAVNPDFGTLADLKSFVGAAHKLGMHVILDWVANHSAWDNKLTSQHPDWYEHDWKGAFHPTTWWDWADIIDFDYTKPALRQYMTGALKYWVKEAGVDGYRCDVAGQVPIDFWENVRAELDAIKPVFMLAEWEYPELHRRAFDATYAWGWEGPMHEIGAGRAGPDALYTYYAWNDGAWPVGAMRMLFTSNHDKNSWEGTEFERFGPNLANTMVLSFVSEGIPLIYNGQEAGNTKRLAFFERDPIVWRDHPNGAFFKRLIALKKAHPALWNGAWGARMVPVVNSAPNKVLSFVRQKGDDKLLAMFNMSAQAQTVTLTDGPSAGRYRDWETGAAVTIADQASVTLPAWSYRVLTTR